MKIAGRIFLLFCLYSCTVFAQESNQFPKEVQALLSAYPSFIKGYEQNAVLFHDGSRMVFDDGKNKSYQEMLDKPDLKDLFVFPYPKGKIEAKIEKNNDPGRIRNDELLKKMYGSTLAEVQKNLVEIVWCPRLLNQKIKVTSRNNVHEQLQKISLELDKHPEWKAYLQSSGAFNWRIIRGTTRLSMHSFGIAIDLNTKYSNYWQWDCRCTKENTDLGYKNQIPQGIVDIFEQYGFIWGGKWYHYDTMHFEYRPELLF